MSWGNLESATSFIIGNMLLTITPNPAIDRTLIVSHITPGAIHRAGRCLVAAGGKGLNVARGVKQLGGEVLAMGMLGGTSGRWLAQLARDEGIDGEWTFIQGDTRTCTMVVAEMMDATVFNESGPTVPHAEWNRFIKEVVRRAPSHATTCICGSLPPGTPSSAPADLIQSLRAKGLTVWVDTSGDALRSALTAPPTGLKINGREAGDVLGIPINDVHDAWKAATTLRERGIEQVVITLGAMGAVFLNAEGAYHAHPPSVPIVSSVGSGDAFFAGLLTALTNKHSPPEALCRAVAAGTANALAVGGGQVNISDHQILLSQIRLINLTASL